MRDELLGWLQDWKILALGLIASWLDGLVIAQGWDWLTSGHRLSIWLLM